MIFENYKDYLLSLNIAQISREFGFKKLGKKLGILKIVGYFCIGQTKSHFVSIC